VLPRVTSDEPYWDLKRRARELGHFASAEPHYEPIEMPRNSATGFVTAFFAVIAGFSLIWHIWWLAILGLTGAYLMFVVFAWRDKAEMMIPTVEVARLDRENRAARAAVLVAEPLS